jgi:TetR/AcrR family transcriptional repressor of nem operon
VPFHLSDEAGFSAAWSSRQTSAMQRQPQRIRPLVRLATSPCTQSGCEDDYLSDVHRKNPGMGCAFSALASEIVRQRQADRELASEQLRKGLELIVGLLKDKTRRGRGRS